MIKMTTIKFTCPGCHARFEFDAVGENEFVPCPVCGNDCVTIKKGGKIQPQTFDPTEMCEVSVLA
jgi:transcription initiation factor IIE alpha subunit